MSLVWALGFAAPARAGWHAPVSISGRGNIGQATLAVNARGDAIAVWDRETFSRGDIGPQIYAVTAALRPAGGSWQRPITVGTARALCGRTCQPFPALSVAIGPRGDAFVAWPDATTRAHEWIRVASRAAGASWQKPVLLLTYGASPDVEESWPLIEPPKLAVDQHGNATALASGVLAKDKPAGRAWRKPEAVGTGFDEQLALDARGDAIAFWDNPGPSSPRLQAALRPVGGSWGRPVTIGAGAGYVYDTRLAVDSRGDAIAAWDHYPSRGCCASVHAAFKPAGARWGQPVILQRAASVGLIQAAFGKPGNPTVVWATAAGIQARSKPRSGPWRPRVTLVAPAPTAAGSVRLAMDPRGEAIVVWAQPPDPWVCCSESVQASLASPQGIWRAPIILGSVASPGVFGSGAPDVALDSRGDAVVLWARYLSPPAGAFQTIVQARTFTRGG